jgi:predicted DNA repair protein MutK
MAGGVYLAFEGAEKVLEWIFHGKEQEEKEDEEDIDSGDPIELEKKKIDSAIITDFILSIEIVIIALGSVSGQPLSIQIPVVTMVAFLATIGVYALVALIVRLDDMGLALMKMRNEIEIAGLVGKALVSALPLVIRSLTIIGTLAMLLVAGGIFVHHMEALHDTLHMLPLFIAEIVTGFAIGVVAVGIVSLYKKLVSGKSA